MIQILEQLLLHGQENMELRFQDQVYRDQEIDIVLMDGLEQLQYLLKTQD
jgi:hypothetical protein